MPQREMLATDSGDEHREGKRGKNILSSFYSFFGAKSEVRKSGSPFFHKIRVHLLHPWLTFQVLQIRQRAVAVREYRRVGRPFDRKVRVVPADPALTFGSIGSVYLVLDHGRFA